MSLYDRTREVDSPEALRDFALALSNDIVRRDSDAWDNVTIDTYLEAIAGWLDDASTSLRERRLPPESWQVVAQSLLMGKIYE